MNNISLNKIISLYKGDNCDLKVPLDLNGIELTDYDEIYFAIMSYNQTFEDGEVRKIFRKEDVIEGNLILKLLPIDTIYLLPGRYCYSIKLAKKNLETSKYEITTLIGRKQLYVL